MDRLGKKCVTAELLQPDELISGMISQVAAEPEMALLLNHFIYSTHGEPLQTPALVSLPMQVLITVGSNCHNTV